WKVEEGGILSCGNGPHGSDLFTEQKFTDFELHVEFQGNNNSGVYLQGRYEIQVDNSYGAKPKIIEKDGKKIESLDSHQCGALDGKVTEPGPLLLQGDHGKVPFRNVKIKPLAEK